MGAFHTSARLIAKSAHPDHAQLCAAADAARNAHEQARRALAEATRRRDEQLDPFGPVAWTSDPAGSPSSSARALRAHHVHAAWSTSRRAAGLPYVHLHDLRHAGLTLAAQSGATLAEVMRRAGHSSSGAAMIYQHAAERRDAQVAERLGRLAAGTMPNRTGT